MSERLDELDSTPEMLELAKELLGILSRFSEAKPKIDIENSMKGLGAVIRELDIAGGSLSPSELAEHTGVSDARIANILRVLQERGLVERRQSATDKRRATITLTEAGRQDCSKRRNESERAVAAFLSRMGKADSQELIRLIDKTQKTLLQLRKEGFEPRPPLEHEFCEEN